tara:strand:- start:67 stop:282 length:216 start_codon:yes stop_codon:yes gene_type:complete
MRGTVARSTPRPIPDQKFTMRILLAIALILAVLWVSTGDHALDVEQHKQYVTDYCNGFHPDYKNIKPDCTK